MKMIHTFLTAIFCAASPLLAVDDLVVEPKSAEQTVKTDFKLGKEIVSAVRADYENGKHAAFLEQMEASYQEALSQNQLESLVETRLNSNLSAEDQEKWEASFLQLQKEKNDALLNAVSDEDDSLFAEKVRSIAAGLSSSDQEKAIAQLSLFRSMAPQTGKNNDENRLIDLDLEYEYKLVHLDIPLAQKFSVQEHRESILALKMEKMKKMVDASKSFQDLALKQAVGMISANFDERLAQNWDALDLKDIAKGKIKPSSALEEKAALIFSSYQGKFSDLLNKYAEVAQQNQ